MLTRTIVALLAMAQSTRSSAANHPALDQMAATGQPCRTTGQPPLSVHRKRGLAYNAAGLVPYFFTGGNTCAPCGWAYNWDSRDNGLAVGGLEYVPMLWGPIADHTGRWRANAEEMLGKGSTHLLSFNECDRADQCNTSAAEAAQAHVEHMNPFSRRARIGSPAVSNSDVGSEGLDWLRDWVDACHGVGCAYDFCVVHWYSPREQTASLVEHVRQASAICGGKPIWLTEFSLPPPSQDDIGLSEWLSDVLPVLDGLECLERYAFFMVEHGKLVRSGGLSRTGVVYASE
ncbi:glycosyl hydrolase catalytic core-domain-containing protein [Plectosphaerella cucumerina]|uniref:Glycosyl hydrolase catalytic core-domain-containing protein n=1 Tax=Plectosphaerella cucumerina TaxID=40658 RepID=A0A8K0X678_9PEZI|nr:glycosyl hydrolase catalytic core-domain-containing protein [Plectosphaerella cucumerina]